MYIIKNTTLQLYIKIILATLIISCSKVYAAQESTIHITSVYKDLVITSTEITMTCIFPNQDSEFNPVPMLKEMSNLNFKSPKIKNFTNYLLTHHGHIPEEKTDNNNIFNKIHKTFVYLGLAPQDTQIFDMSKVDNFISENKVVVLHYRSEQPKIEALVILNYKKGDGWLILENEKVHIKYSEALYKEVADELLNARASLNNIKHFKNEDIGAVNEMRDALIKSIQSQINATIKDFAKKH